MPLTYIALCLSYCSGTGSLHEQRRFDVCSSDQDGTDAVLLALLNGGIQSKISGFKWNHGGFDERLLYFMDTKTKELNPDFG